MFEVYNVFINLIFGELLYWLEFRGRYLFYVLDFLFFYSKGKMKDLKKKEKKIYLWGKKWFKINIIVRDCVFIYYYSF